MRIFEWIALFAFLPILLRPFWPVTLQQHWLVLATLLPIMAVIVHIGIEGWRIYMLPIYLLAGLIGLLHLPEWRGRTASARRRGVTSGILALLVLLSGVVAGWLLPVVALPPPTGPYAVGIVDRELTDQARGRRLMVSIWYPAAQSGVAAPLIQHPRALEAGLERLTGLPGVLFQQLGYTTLAASQAVPALDHQRPFPVLIFSHGMVGMRLQNSSTMQDLASWGYVVVAIDHTDAAAITIFSDGTSNPHNLERFGIPASVIPTRERMNQHVFPVWVADQRFIYDMLEDWATTDPLLAGRLDLAQVGSFGHSFGGATALEVCLVEVRCRAAANLDGGLYGAIETQPAVRPLLLMTSAESRELPEAMARWKNLIAKAQAPAYWLEVLGSNHYSFTIVPLISPVLAPLGFAPHAGLQTVDAQLRSFFDQQLRGECTPIQPTIKLLDVYWYTKAIGER
jgi:predicted dienelactone hydrolase